MVIGIDVNDDVRSCAFSEAMGQLRLVKVITMRHGHDVPCTHNHGSKPIDGIYVSHTLHGCQCGYLPFGNFDHRMLWLDLPNVVTFGQSLPTIIRPPA